MSNLIVLGFDDEREGQLGDRHVRVIEDGEVGRRQDVLPEDHLGDDFVQRKGVGQRARADVGHTDHLQNTGYVGIARLPLDTIGKVEGHTRTLSL